MKKAKPTNLSKIVFTLLVIISLFSTPSEVRALSKDEVRQVVASVPEVAAKIKEIEAEGWKEVKFSIHHIGPYGCCDTIGHDMTFIYEKPCPPGYKGIAKDSNYQMRAHLKVHYGFANPDTIMGEIWDKKCYECVLEKVEFVPDVIGVTFDELETWCVKEESGETPEERSSEEQCFHPPEIEEQRQGVVEKIKERYGIEVLDSNLCGVDVCGNNFPWSVAELSEMEKLLDSLPDCFINNLEVPVISGLMEDGLIAAARQQSCCKTEDSKPSQELVSCGGYLFIDNHVVFCGHGELCIKEGATLGGILVHELTHAFQQYGAIPPTHRKLPNGAYTNPVVIAWLKETGWSPDGICVPFLGCPGARLELPPDLPTEYARKTRNPLEDMAESVRLYVTDPARLIEVSPRRYNFVKEKIMCGREYHE